MMERMGCEGRILTFTDADSPPAWGVLSVMNWSEREMECVKWLNWLEAEEDYEKREPASSSSPVVLEADEDSATTRRGHSSVSRCAQDYSQAEAAR